MIQALSLCLTVATTTEPQLGIAWGFLYGAGGVPAARFVPEVRKLGGGFSKIYLLWSQVEPTKGKHDWSAVDAYVDQLQSPEEGLISIFSSSEWATRTKAAMLPPSPAKSQADYYRFVRDLVSHCKGKVRYWQNDSEPNNPIYWAGTKEEFVAQLKVFHRAVKDADPKASVVAGGYDGLFNPPGIPPMPGQEIGLSFFDYVIKNAGDAFDVFDLRLYANPYTIAGRLDTMRQKMKAAGYQKPVICTEYGGPGLFEFPVNRQYVPLAMAWSQSVQKGDFQSGKAAIADLYQKMNTLAPQTQIFMQGCSPELQAKFERIQARDLVMRNVFALAAGVEKTLYWDLWNDSGERDNLMTLMYGKIKMLEYDGKRFTKRFPVADAFARMAERLRGSQTVRRISVEGQPSLYLFEVQRAKRSPLFVVWEQRDSFSGEDQPAKEASFAWSSKAAKATDALGKDVSVEVRDGWCRLPVSVTPIFVESR